MISDSGYDRAKLSIFQFEALVDGSKPPNMHAPKHLLGVAFLTCIWLVEWSLVEPRVVHIEAVGSFVVVIVDLEVALQERLHGLSVCQQLIVLANEKPTMFKFCVWEQFGAAQCSVYDYTSKRNKLAAYTACMKKVDEKHGVLLGIISNIIHSFHK